MKRFFASLSRPLLLLLLTAACAQQGAPPGGPIDNTEPEVIATTPAADSAGVIPPYSLTIQFSEKMNRRSVDRGLRIFPEPAWVETEWEGNTLIMETDHSIGVKPDSGEIIIVTIPAGAQDRRKNYIQAPFLLSFTSRDSMPSGVVTGKVTGMRRGRDLPPVTLRAVTTESMLRPLPVVLLESETARTGEFEITHLPVGRKIGFRLIAFMDDDENGTLDRESEDYGFSDTLFLTPSVPRIDSLTIELINATTPAMLSGRVTLDIDFDSVVVTVKAERDSVGPEVTAPDSLGAFHFASLPAGEYSVRLLRATRAAVLTAGEDFAPEVVAERALSLEPGEKVEEFLLPEDEKNSQVTQ